jgi:hypothetical protein
MTEGNIVVLFRTFEDLQRDEQKIMKDYFAEWEAAYARFDVAQAAINGDNTALAKFADADVSLAKAAVESSIRKYGDTGVADVGSVARLASDLKASVTKRDERLYGMSALAKRSRRFAMASERRYYGPAAAVTTIGAKQ